MFFAPEISNTTSATTRAQYESRHLPTVDRNIKDENSFALIMRWTLARNGTINDPRIMNRWFPSQTELFKILSVLTEQQVIDLADCSMPLFSLRLPSVANDGVFHRRPPSTALEAACLEESAIALVSRLDALRTGMTQACILFDVNSSQAAFISRHSSRELHAIASDPAVGLIPASTDEFFTVAAMSTMSTRERTVLATTTRRNRALSH